MLAPFDDVDEVDDGGIDVVGALSFVCAAFAGALAVVVVTIADAEGMLSVISPLRAR